MNRTLTVLLTVAMLVASAAPAVAMAAPTAAGATGDAVHTDTTTVPDDTDENASDVSSPGAKLAGSIGVGQSEMNGAIEQRAFGHQIAAAATNDSRAQVLKLTQDRTQERLTDLEERKASLDEARENGTISESQYRAQVSVVAAESARIQSMANTTERTAQDVPNETLEANGVDVTALQQLRDRAHDVTGPEVAEIARQIAGNDVGAPMGPPENVPGPQAGMDDRPGKASDDRSGNATEERPGSGGDDRGGMNEIDGQTTTNATDTTTVESGDSTPDSGGA